ncbi:MAG: hypothetical protein WC595_05630 [Candidatus Nanoarchaeia archaeon]
MAEAKHPYIIDWEYRSPKDNTHYSVRFRELKFANPLHIGEEFLIDIHGGSNLGKIYRIQQAPHNAEDEAQSLAYVRATDSHEVDAMVDYLTYDPDEIDRESISDTLESRVVLAVLAKEKKGY